MNTSIQNISKFSVIIALLSFTLIGCGGDGGTDSNPNPDPDPNPSVSFDSGNISPGAEFSFTFDSEAMADYICTIHPEMQGSVTVQEGASSEQDTVIIDNLEFTPADITIPPGTEVTWINQDDVTHTATSQ